MRAIALGCVTRAVRLTDCVQHDSRRGLAAPLLFCTLGFATAGSVVASPMLWAAGVLALGALWLVWSEPGLRFSPIGVAIGAYAFWVVVTNTFLSPVYTPAAPFHVTFLVLGYLIAHHAGTDPGQSVYRAVVVLGVLLSGWALWQIGFTGMARASAGFESPATLAAMLNFALVPLLVRSLVDRRRAFELVLAIVIFAGVVAASSRGGWVALAAGMVLAVALLRRAGITLTIASGARLIGIAAAGLSVGMSISLFGPMMLDVIVKMSGIFGPGGAHEVVGNAAGIREIAPSLTSWLVHAISTESGVSRLELWGIAWGALPPLPWQGAGYLSYLYLLESMRLAVSSYGTDSITYFVHNDYLQTLYELGITGAAAMVAMIVVPQLALWRTISQPALERTRKIHMLSSASVLGAMSVHAFVDFPFYVPVCLLLFGLHCGVVARECGPERPVDASVRALPRARRTVGIAAAISLAGLLAIPVAAEAAAEYAHYAWRNGMSQRAAYWFTVARRIDPRDWRFHFYEAHFWAAHAAENGSAVAARLADLAFAAGIVANSRDVRSILGRLDVQREFARLLDHPMSPAAQLQLAEQARQMAPLNLSVRIAHVRTLAKNGERAELAPALAALERDWPNERQVGDLVKRLGDPSEPL